jgi:tRNA A-37 threonylcarbamoyl transferase component Bud32/curved DNA-binding protein CbpA
MTTPKKPFLFFDLEAGGLSGHQSSILSISYGRPGEKVQSLYADPAYGSRVYQWSNENVWRPIKERLQTTGQKATSEQTALESFLGVLETSEEGGTLAGWNIGYQRQGQTFGERTQGFDIPMLLTRAKAYGLENRYQAALGKFKIRDIGQEYAWKVANEAYQFPELIEQDFYSQIKTYVESGKAYQHQSGATDQQTAKWLATQGYKVAGWKQEDLYKLLGVGEPLRAHLSEEDVMAGQQLADLLDKPIFGGDPEKVKAWHQQALRRKYISSIRSGNTPEKITEILQKAKSPVSFGGGALPSIEEGLLGDIRELASSYKVAPERIMAGEAIKETSEKFFLNKPGFNKKIFADMLSSAKAHPLLIGTGVGLAAAWVLKPLSMFSGKDDKYNTIEGLRHGGQAEKKRKELTDFGSGYQLIKYAGKATREVPLASIRKQLQSEFIGRTGFSGWFKKAADMGELVLSTLSGERTSLKRTITHSFDSNKAKEIYKDLAMKYHPDRGGSTSHMQELNSLYQEIKKTGQLKETYAEFTKTQVNAIGAAGGAGLIGAGLYANNIQEERRKKEREKRVQRFIEDLRKKRNRFSGRDDSHNTIEGLRHGGIAERKRKELTHFGSGFDPKQMLSEYEIDSFKRAFRELHNTSWAPEVRHFMDPPQVTSIWHKIGQNTTYNFLNKQVTINYGELGRLKNKPNLSKALNGLQDKQVAEVALGHELGHARVGVNSLKGKLATVGMSGRFAGIGSAAINLGLPIYTLATGANPLPMLGVSAGLSAAAGLSVLFEERQANKTLGHFLEHGAKWDKKLISEFLPKWNKAHNLHYGKAMLMQMGLPILMAGIQSGIAYGIHKLFAGDKKGTKKKTRAVNKITAKDDAHNTIEGLRHGGEAEKKRKELTDFGSGWVGGVINMVDDAAILVYRTAPGRQFIDRSAEYYDNHFSAKDDNYVIIDAMPHGWFGMQRKENTHFGSGYTGKETAAERFEIFKKALEAYGQETGTGHKRIIIPKYVISEEEMEKELGFVPVKVAIPESGQDRWTSWRNTRSTYHIHSHGDAWTMHRDEHEASTMLLKRLYEQKKEGKDVSFIQPVLEFLRGIPHVITEGIPGAFYYLKGQVFGGEDLAKRLGKEINPRYMELVNTLADPGNDEEDLAALKKSVDAKWQHRDKRGRFSGFKDAYNNIEGLGHKGIAWIGRKLNTDFGSGWDSLRGLVRAGETFESMLATSEFKSALAGARQLEVLGEGVQGQVFKMSSEFRGQRFEFARKIGEIGKNEPETLKELMSLGYEHSPSLYGVGKNTLDIELFHGKALSRVDSSVLHQYEQGAEEALRKLHQLGFEHNDVALRNIMAVDTPLGPRVGLVDYGLTRRPAASIDPFAATGTLGAIDIGGLKTAFKSTQTTSQAAKATSIMSSGESNVDNAFDELFGESPAPQINKVAQANLQRKTVEDFWTNASTGGIKHRKKSGGLVQ